MNEIKKYNPPPEIVSNNTVALAFGLAISNLMSKWGMPQLKLFFCFLEEIDWASEYEDGDEYVCLSKERVKECLSLNFADDGHKSFDTYLRRELKKLVTNSCIDFKSKEDRRIYGFANFFREAWVYPKHITIIYDPKFKPLLFVLANRMQYFTICAEDIYGFQSKHTFPLYMKLRLSTDEYNRVTQVRDFTTWDLKNIFNMDKDAYMQTSTKREKSGKCFAFANFERRVLDPVMEDLSRCKGITIIPTKDKSYEVIRNPNVSYDRKYRFRFEVNEKVKLGEDGQAEFVPMEQRRFNLRWTDKDIVEIHRLANNHVILSAMKKKEDQFDWNDIEDQFGSAVMQTMSLTVSEVRQTYDNAEMALKKMNTNKYYQLR